MKMQLKLMLLLMGASFIILTGCKKDDNLVSPTDSSSGLEQPGINSVNTKAPTPAIPNFNLEVILRGDGNAFGHVKFRQDNDVDKIITLDTWVRDLEPNHQYLLQRAVDAINIVDGNCTSTSWLTLGLGLTPQSITTDENGTGEEVLWRSVAAVPSGSSFDIHFQVVDALSKTVVLTSDCYEYTVR